MFRLFIVFFLSLFLFTSCVPIPGEDVDVQYDDLDGVDFELIPEKEFYATADISKLKCKFAMDFSTYKEYEVEFYSRKTDTEQNDKIQFSEDEDFVETCTKKEYILNQEADTVFEKEIFFKCDEACEYQISVLIRAIPRLKKNIGYCRKWKNISVF